MLTFPSTPSRRGFLTVGGLFVGGLNFAYLLRLRAHGTTTDSGRFTRNVYRGEDRRGVSPVSGE